MKWIIYLSLMLCGAITAFGSRAPFDEPTIELYRIRLGLSTQDFEGPRDLELLTKLFQQHVIHIPFENFYMHTSPARVIKTDQHSLIEKVLKGSNGWGRGGYCYEINELFYGLLNSLGFDVQRHKASVWMGKDPDVIPWPSHQFSSVKIDGTTYLADVAFGLFTLFNPVQLPEHRLEFSEPEHRLEFSEIVDNNNRRIRFEKVLFDEGFGPEQMGREGFIYSRYSKNKEKFERISTFTLEPYQADDFVEHNDYVQNYYQPFKENIFFTRFDTQGTMHSFVRSRSKIGDCSELIQKLLHDSTDT